MRDGRLEGHVDLDDARLAEGQVRVARELETWLAGSREQPFVGSYGDRWRNLWQALGVLGVGFLVFLVFFRPRIEIRSTEDPRRFLVRARGILRTRDVTVNEPEAGLIAVRSTPRFGLLSNRVVFRKPGEPEIALMPFGTLALGRAVTTRQRLVDVILSAGQHTAG